MTRRDGLIRLEHMLEAAREAVALVRGRTKKEIEGDRVRVLALERLFEVIGEAAAQTTAEIRDRSFTLSATSAVRDPSAVASRICSTTWLSIASAGRGDDGQASLPSFSFFTHR